MMHDALNIIGQLDDLLIDRRALASHATIASLNLQLISPNWVRSIPPQAHASQATLAF